MRNIRLHLSALLAAAILAGPLLTSCASTSPPKKPKPPPPAPESVSSLILRPAWHSRNYFPRPRYSRTRLQEFFDSYDLDYVPWPRELAGRMYDRSMRTIASGVRRAPHADALIDGYERSIDDVEEKFRDVEETLTDFGGIKRSEFRVGAGVTSAAALTTLGGLHLLKPTASLGVVPGTSLEARYNLEQLDDPKLIFSRPGSSMNVTLSKDGLAGALARQNRVYQLGLDVQHQSATANLSFQNGISLGSKYSVKDEEVLGFLNLDL